MGTRPVAGRILPEDYERLRRACDFMEWADAQFVGLAIRAALDRLDGQNDLPAWMRKIIVVRNAETGRKGK